jgi:PAS domain S-box-containing protein
MKTAGNRFPSQRIWFAILIAILLGVVAIFANGLAQRYNDRLTRATGVSESMSRVLEQHAASILQKADLVLLHVAEELEHQGQEKQFTGPELDNYLKELKLSLPEVRLLRVVDAEGHRFADTTGISSRLYSGDRDYFIRHRDNPNLGLLISDPVKGRSFPGWQIVLSRRINKPDGSFGGIVTSSISLSYFEDFFRSLNLGTDSNITLLSSDFRVIARYPSSDHQHLKSVRNGQIFQASRQNPEHGTLIGISAVDGVERIFSYRKVDQFPLYVVVGLSKKEQLADWRRNALFDGGAMLLLLGAIGWLAYNLLRQYERERESKRQLREITTTMGEGLYVLDREGRITFANPEAQRLLGWSEEELVGRNAHALFHYRMADGTPYPAEECAIRQVTTNGQGYRSDDETFWRRDGSPLPVAVIASPIVREGKIIGSVEAFQDISRRKQAEQELKSLNENLEQRVHGEVAKNMEQERLLIQQSRLAAMGEMIGNIAHQWRQPLNALNLLLANIKDAFEYGELDRDYLDQALADGNQLVQRMSTTIDDFRNFFNPNKVIQNFSLNRAISAALSLVSHGFKNHNIAILVEEGEDWQARGFPNEFSQVLLNILANAKEAILERQVPQGKIEITLGAEGPLVWVAVRDNGGGIPDAVMARIFEPYFTTKEKGTGIGLYMSRMIMEHMHGAIGARNVDGGTEFRLELPKAEAPSTPTE